MSNFVQWWHKNMPHFECSDDEALDIWNAAAASEREACATVCDQGLHQVRENGWIDAANERARCAAAIRQRSITDIRFATGAKGLRELSREFAELANDAEELEERASLKPSEEDAA